MGVNRPHSKMNYHVLMHISVFSAKLKSSGLIQGLCAKAIGVKKSPNEILLKTTNALGTDNKSSTACLSY